MPTLCLPLNPEQCPYVQGRQHLGRHGQLSCRSSHILDLSHHVFMVLVFPVNWKLDIEQCCPTETQHEPHMSVTFSGSHMKKKKQVELISTVYFI